MNDKIGFIDQTTGDWIDKGAADLRTAVGEG